MSSQFRATGPHDAAAVALFLREIFGMAADNPVINPAHMQWKYWREHPEWEGSRGFVIEREQKIVAHGSVIPLRCLSNSQSLALVTLIDWAAHPSSTGAGIALLKRVSQMADGVFVAGGSEMTQKILPALGFKESVTATQFALPLRPLRRLLGESNASWRSAARFGRNFLWKLRSAPSHVPGWGSRRVLPEDIAAMHFPSPQPKADTAVFERTAKAMGFLLECPAAPAKFYLVEKDGAVCGYFVLTFALTQCRIADAWVESDQAEDWTSLYRIAAQRAKEHPQTVELATVASTEIAARALRQNGFQPRGQVKLRFLLRGSSPPAALHYQLIDGDGAYLHDGLESFWA